MKINFKLSYNKTMSNSLTAFSFHEIKTKTYNASFETESPEL